MKTDVRPVRTRVRGAKRFKSLTDVTREMSIVYTEGRLGKIDLADMSRYVNALNYISGTISKQRELDLEKRLVKLEEGE